MPAVDPGGGGSGGIGVGGGGGSPGPSGWAFEIWDIKTDSIVLDVTNFCLSAKISPQLNRPLGIELTLPMDFPDISGTWPGDDGYVLEPGTRAVKAWQDGELRGHAAIWTLSYSGGTGWDQKVVVSTLDPMARLQTRLVWDSIGRIQDLRFAGGGAVDAGTMIKAVIDNAAADGLGDDGGDDKIFTDPVTLAAVTPAIFPIDTSDGLFTTTNDLSAYWTDLPMSIGDFVTTLIDSGEVDFVLEPVDSSDGYAAGIMARLNVVPSWGSDISESVHFDYATGDCNVGAARRILDLSNLANRIQYELGPKKSNDHWAAGVNSNAVDEFFHQQLRSRHKYGTYSTVYQRLWEAEALLRLRPRDLLYLQPVASNPETPFEPMFRPFIDYGIGDIVAVSAGAVLGPAFSASKQRIYGFEVEIDLDGTERVSELITSADAES
jgi:hypothetical protein